MIKTLLFDFDGVLVDSFEISYRSSRLTNQGKMNLKLYRSLFEGNIYKGLSGLKLKKKSGLDFFDYYGPRLEKLKLVPKGKNVIKLLAKKYRLIIVSSTPSVYIEKFFDKHGVKKYFSEILGSDFHKSKVNKIKYILKKYRLNSKDCLFITDTLGDIKEAEKCGVKSLAVKESFHFSSTLRLGKPLKILDSLEELPLHVLNYFEYE